MKNILLIISLFAICVGVKGQTMKGDVRPKVLIETTMGNIRVELYNETPLHRDNFLKLIREDHFYDSLLFHRVIPDFMIQGGDPSSKNAPKGAMLVYGRRQGEKGLQRGRENLEKLFGDSIRMTKEMEDVYTTVGGTPHLDGAYTVFGQVVEGMDVVDRIQHVERDANDRPLEDVRIIRATILRDK